MSKFKAGETAYIIENNHRIRQVIVKSYAGGFYVVRFTDKDAGARLRESRLYPSEDTAKAALPPPEPPQKRQNRWWDH